MGPTRLTLGMMVMVASGSKPVVLAAQHDSGVFRLYQGTTEIGREVYRIEPRAIESMVTFPMGGTRVESKVEFGGPEGHADVASMIVKGLTNDTVRQAYSARQIGDSLHLNLSGATTRSWVKRSDAETIAPDQSVAAYLRVLMANPGRTRAVRVWVPNADSTISTPLGWRGDTADMTIGSLRMSFVVAADGRVIRGTIMPGAFRFERYVGDPMQLPPLAGLARPTPDYTAPAGVPFTATEVRVPVRSADGDSFALACTFTVPRAGGPRWPAVVTSTGSGQQDRDETLWPILPEYRLFRQVAERLAREKIAVLRCDDRSVGGSGGPLMAATTADFAGDVAAQVAWLRARTDVDAQRLGIVGHSEGGIIGPMVAARDPQLAAIVVLAGPAKPGREVLRDQFVRPVEADTSIPPAQRAAALATAEQAMDAFIAASSWTRWFAAYDPRETAQRVRQPVLILQSTLDQQVSVGQADTLAAALRAGGNRDVTVRILPGLNHLFLRSPAGTGSVQEYGGLTDVTVPSEVLDTLAAWLRHRLYR